MQLREVMRDLHTIASVLEDVYIGLVNPKDIAAVRLMEPEHWKGAIAQMLFSLDNSVEAEESDPDYFCVDWHIDAIESPETVRAIVDSECTDAKSVAEWLEDREG